MQSSNVNSQFTLIKTLHTDKNNGRNFGQHVKWITDDIFGAVYTDTTSSTIDDIISFEDGTSFDGNQTNFGEETVALTQELKLFQVVTTDADWISSTDNGIQPVEVNRIAVSSNVSPSEILFAGDTDNLFVADRNNPSNPIYMYNNQSLTHGWTRKSSNEPRIDGSSISRAWLYDSVTLEKIVDLDVVDLINGVLPPTVAQYLDYSASVDPALYNTPSWRSGCVYAIGDLVTYSGVLYKALYAGKSGGVFNEALWKNLGALTTQSAGTMFWGAEKAGTTWFNTKNVKVIDAQKGELGVRVNNWNKWFAGSTPVVYEWVASATIPAAYTQGDPTGYLDSIDTPFVYDANAKKYCFWVYGKTTNGSRHEINISSLTQYLSNLSGSGIPMISAIDNNSVALWNLNNYVSKYNAILHIDYVSASAHNNLHNEFVLIGNDGSKSWFKTPLYQKVIDSLCGIAETSSVLVPDYTLPDNQLVGISDTVSQSLFSDRVSALKIYYDVINQNLSNCAVATLDIITALSDKDPMPTDYDLVVSTRDVLDEMNPSDYNENYKILVQSDSTIINDNWSVVYSDGSSWIHDRCCTYDLSNKWEYSDWYSSAYTGATPTYVIAHTGSLNTIEYSLGDIIEVEGSGIIYQVVKSDIDSSILTIEPVFIKNGTIQFTDNLFDFNAAGIGFDAANFDSCPFDNVPYLEIRKITHILNEKILTSSKQLAQAADDAFFALVKYIMYENKNLDWLFKTSFVSVDYNNRDLSVRGTFEPDNQTMIQNFIDETTPFHTRIREFNNTFSGTDVANISVQDFDLPSQFDTNYYNMILATTNNPKPNTPFLEKCGVYQTDSALYVTSDGLPVGGNTMADSVSWKFAIPTADNTSNIKFESFYTKNGSQVATVVDGVYQNIDALPLGVAIDGVPFFSPNSGNSLTVYNSSNLAQVETHVMNDGYGANVHALIIVDDTARYIGSPSTLDTGNATTHSPLLGFAIDGNPIYGAYGYSGNAVVKHTSSYQLKNITRLEPTGVANGVQLGVAVQATGRYIDDYQFVDGSGTLDVHNGIQCVTPEYPNGTYAYFMTDQYPYVVGPTFNGIPFNTRYAIINGESIPFYLNGSVSIPYTAVANSISFVRSVDGSQLTDANTLSTNPMFSAWNNNHAYSISALTLTNSGSGYLDTSANVFAAGANIAVNSLKLVSASVNQTGAHYAADDIVALNGYIGNILVNSTFANGGINSFTLQPANIAFTTISIHSGIPTTNYTGNGAGATFDLSYGINDFVIHDGGSFITTPSVVIIDANASVDATVRPELSNDLIRAIDTELRFDRVSSAIEYGNTTCKYPANSIVYVNGSFLKATNANALIANSSMWTTATDEEVSESTAMNRLVFYSPSLNSRGNLYSSSSNITTTGLDLAPSYIPPSSSIFNIEEANVANVILNISWRPSVITDTIFDHEHARFSNTAGCFNSSYITASNIESDISVGSGAFTVEFLFRLNSLANAVMLDTRSSINSDNGLVVSNQNGNIVASCSQGSITSNIAVTANSWNYIVVAGNTSNVVMYLNGEKVGDMSPLYSMTDSALTIGADVSGNNIMSGYMDELRITKEFNRYAKTTPVLPSAPFPRTKEADSYYDFTAVLFGFETMNNEVGSTLSFNSVNSTKYVTDQSWDQKQLILHNVTIDGTSEDNIMVVKVNE